MVNRTKLKPSKIYKIKSRVKKNIQNVQSWAKNAMALPLRVYSRYNKYAPVIPKQTRSHRILSTFVSKLRKLSSCVPIVQATIPQMFKKQVSLGPVQDRVFQLKHLADNISSFLVNKKK